MFWKKKPTDDLSIELPEADDDTLERRESFRISTTSDDVLVRIGEQDCRVVNISAGGLALKASGLREGYKYSIRLQLPDASPAIHTELEVISITRRGVCRCKFLQLSALSRNAIHRYILSREKAQIRTSRVRSAPSETDE